MLEIIEYGKDEYAFPSLLVLGCFDAIHAGHRELFKKARLQAKINGLDLGVMMFRDGKGGKLVYSFEERVSMLSAYGVKFVLVIDYTPEFKQTMPLDFLSTIEEKVNVKAYMSGKDFRFGKGAKGKASTLKNYAEDEENGVWYMPLKDVLYEGEKISTTLIKSCLDEGDVRKASALLGENFFVEGTVVEGAHRGTGVLGFPTVNIDYPEWKYPVKHGVYKVTVTIDGAEYSGIANFGGRPTFGDDSEVLEVHIKDFEGDLYGKNIKIGFVGFMRNIRKFADASALAEQLEQDKTALDLSDEQFFARYPLEEGEPELEETEEPQLEQECTPPTEVFEGAPAVEPEVALLSEPAEPEEKVLSEEEVVEEVSARPEDITPAWQLLSEPAVTALAVQPAPEEGDKAPADEQNSQSEDETVEPDVENETIEEVTADVAEEPSCDQSENISEQLNDVQAEPVEDDTPVELGDMEVSAEEILEEAEPVEEVSEEVKAEEPMVEPAEELVAEKPEELEPMVEPAEEPAVEETKTAEPTEETQEGAEEAEPAEDPAEENVKTETTEEPAEETDQEGEKENND